MLQVWQRLSSLTPSRIFSLLPWNRRRIELHANSYTDQNVRIYFVPPVRVSRETEEMIQVVWTMLAGEPLSVRLDRTLSLVGVDTAGSYTCLLYSTGTTTGTR